MHIILYTTFRSAYNAKRKPIGSYRENYAYSLGIQAYIYGYPFVLMERTRQLQSTLDITTNPPLTASNVLFYVTISPEFTDVVTPNVDTVYCAAFLELSQNPVDLNVPDTNDRYYVAQIRTRIPIVREPLPTMRAIS